MRKFLSSVPSYDTVHTSPPSKYRAQHKECHYKLTESSALHTTYTALNFFRFNFWRSVCHWPCMALPPTSLGPHSQLPLPLQVPVCGGRGITMETRMVMQREQEEQSTQMSHSMQLSSQIKKKTFTSRCKQSPDIRGGGSKRWREIIYLSQSIIDDTRQVFVYRIQNPTAVTAKSSDFVPEFNVDEQWGWEQSNLKTYSSMFGESVLLCFQAKIKQHLYCLVVAREVPSVLLQQRKTESFISCHQVSYSALNPEFN